MDQVLLDLQTRLMSLVGDAARSTTDGGRCTIRPEPDEGEAIVRLAPKNDSACQIAIGTGDWEEANIYIGKCGTSLLIIDLDRESFERKLSAMVDSVVAGRYEEWIRRHHDAPHQAEGVFHLSNGDAIRCSQNTFNSDRDPKPPEWQHVTYEPY